MLTSFLLGRQNFPFSIPKSHFVIRLFLLKKDRPAPGIIKSEFNLMKLFDTSFVTILKTKFHQNVLLYMLFYRDQ